MTVMDCSALGVLIANHEPIELIDVRSKNEFAAMHIPGARSLPAGNWSSASSNRCRGNPRCELYEANHDLDRQAQLAQMRLLVKAATSGE